MGLTRVVTGPRALPRWAVASLVGNIGIVVTGGLVRLTGSGLGCPTWPRCTEDSFVSHPALGVHGAIEFGNRLLTLGLANLVYVLLLVGGGLVIPVDRYPDAVQPIVQVLPTGALGEGLRTAASGGVLGWPILVLLGWLAAGVLVARKAFRWI